MRTSNLWTLAADGRWRSVSCHVPIWMSSSGSVAASEQGDVTADNQVLVTQIEPDDSACSVLLRPEGSTVELRINGIGASSGLHVLRHGDHISVDGRDLWVSVRATPDHETYDPRRHGTPAYCARSKARLQPDDEVVVCRGRPDRDCGLLYTADAWSLGIPCHECGAEADAPEWSPPAETKDASVEELMRLVDAIVHPASRGS